MIHPALGLPLPLALERLGEENCRVEWTRPPRRPDKTGRARVAVSYTHLTLPTN